MSIPRLLILSVLILTWVASVGAQSPEKNAASPPADALNLPRTTLVAPGTGEDTFTARTASGLLESRLLQHALALEQNNATCYSIRLYRVKRDDPQSDTTRAAGYSTCQPAARFQVKTAVDSVEIAPR
ncbi:MAG: hypothetical protein ABSA78_05455 [Candidatus Sulfotelmatobacter sp.]|jgi:hypothetical protein